MKDWRDHVLAQFPVNGPELMLVSDVDGLLADESVGRVLRERGYDHLVYDDPVAFRYTYEREYRRKTGKGCDRHLVTSLAGSELRRLPYDVWSKARCVVLSLAAIFPNLSYPTLRLLDKEHLDRLYQVREHYDGLTLGDQATLEFLLEKVFDMRTWELREPRRLLPRLLQRHYKKESVPPSIDQRLVDTLRKEQDLGGWPLEKIVPSRSAFLDFLQGQWPHFLQKVAGGCAGVSMEEDRPAVQPVDVPFGEPDSRAYVDTYFLEGLLTPIRFSGLELIKEDHEWARVGLIDDGSGGKARVDRLLERAIATTPEESEDHRSWLEQARRLAELSVRIHELEPAQRFGLDDRITAMRLETDRTFHMWLTQHYASLATLPPLSSPVMVHHIPRYLAARIHDEPDRRFTLMVVDGLALDQWVAIRDELIAGAGHPRLDEGAAYAWIPTLTGISRQAMFAGELPRSLGRDLHRTNTEPKWWGRFWTNQALGPSEYGYVREVEDCSNPELNRLLDNPRLRVLGMVVPTVDKMIHGHATRRNVLVETLRGWIREGYLPGLVRRLIDDGFEVILTADHGNVEGRGIGSPREGSLSEVAGTRVRLYPNSTLREHVAQQVPTALPWPSVGLPEESNILLAPPGAVFLPFGKVAISHGGTSLDEVVVPFIRMWKD